MLPWARVRRAATYFLSRGVTIRYTNVVKRGTTRGNGPLLAVPLVFPPSATARGGSALPGEIRRRSLLAAATTRARAFASREG